MSNQKNQHYVPKCYMKNFSPQISGDCINIYNITQDRFIYNAPTKGQCSRNFFYGSDLVIENILSSIEGQYANLVKQIQEDPHLTTNEDLIFIRYFSHLQYMRTENAAKRSQEAFKQMEDLAFSDSNEEFKGIISNDKDHVLENLKFQTKTNIIINDLKCKLIINKSLQDFITNDDPTVICNKYYAQKHPNLSFGLASSGIIIYLPLTPKIAFIAYDSNVYNMENSTNTFIEINKPQPINSLNELSLIKAKNNIYFKQISDEQKFKSNFQSISHLRRESWSSSEEFIEIEEGKFAKITDKDNLKFKNKLIFSKNYYPKPLNWFIHLKYKPIIKTYTNGSAIGYVRKEEWLYMRPV